jgi:Arc/MetJ-type ribon-helix-helix transcriptional regulator
MYAFVYVLGEKMPKTKRGAVSRKNVRIPTSLMDEVDGVVRRCGLYINRQQFIESAIREKIEDINLAGEIDDDFSVRVKETFLAHAIMGMVKEKTLPAHHSDPKQFEQYVRRYVKKRGEREGRKMAKKRLDELTNDILEYHNEILAGLTLMSHH